MIEIKDGWVRINGPIVTSGPELALGGDWRSGNYWPEVHLLTLKPKRHDCEVHAEAGLCRHGATLTLRDLEAHE